MVRIFSAMLLTMAMAIDHSKGNDNWPQFRGPNAAGLAPEGAHLPESWSTTQNVAWKVEIPGRGLSSPIVWGDLVFVTSCLSEGNRDWAHRARRTEPLRLNRSTYGSPSLTGRPWQRWFPAGRAFRSAKWSSMKSRRFCPCARNLKNAHSCLSRSM